MKILEWRRTRLRLQRLYCCFLRYSTSLLPHWGRKKPRSGTQSEMQQKPQFLANAMRSSPSSPLDRRSYDMHELCNSTLRLPQPISQQNDAPAPAKPKRVKNPQRKRRPKKLTISEWREMVDGRVRQNEELRETLERERKELQELRAQNTLLKSELSLHLNLGCNPEKKTTECGPSSADADASKNGATPRSSKDFQKNSDDEYLGRRPACASPCGYSIPSERLFESTQNDMVGQIALRLNKALISA